jgi:hypothetical protein
MNRLRSFSLSSREANAAALALIGTIFVILFAVSSSKSYTIAVTSVGDGSNVVESTSRLVVGQGISGQLSTQLGKEQGSDKYVFQIPGTSGDLVLKREENKVSLVLEHEDLQTLILGPISLSRADQLNSVELELSADASYVSLRFNSKSIAGEMPKGNHTFYFLEAISPGDSRAKIINLTLVKDGSRFELFLILGLICYLSAAVIYIGVIVSKDLGKDFFGSRSFPTRIVGLLMVTSGILGSLFLSGTSDGKPNFEISQSFPESLTPITEEAIVNRVESEHETYSLVLDLDFYVADKPKRELNLFYFGKGPQPGRVFLDEKNRLWVWVPFKDGLSRWQAYSPTLRPGKFAFHLNVKDGSEVQAELNGKSMGVMRWNETLLVPGALVAPAYGSGEFAYEQVISADLSVRSELNGPFLGYKHSLRNLFNFFTLILIITGISLVIASGKFRSETLISLDAFKEISFKPLFLTLIGTWSIFALEFLINFQPTLGSGNYLPSRNSPFAQSAPRFSDFYQLLFYSTNSDPYSFAGSNYPPFAHMILSPLSLVNSTSAHNIYVGLVIGGMIGFLIRTLKWIPDSARLVTIAIILFSYPILFALDRGNIDLVCLLGLLIYARLMFDGKWLSAGLILGTLAAIKVYPLLFAFPFIRERYGVRSFLLASTSFLILTIVAANHYGLAGVEEIFGLITDSSSRVLNPDQIAAWSTSISGFLYATEVVFGNIHIFAIDDVVQSKFFTYSVLIGIATCALFAALARIEIWKKALVVSAAILLLPVISFEYRVGILLVPLLIFTLSSGSSLQFKNLKTRHMILVGLLVGPTSWYYFRGTAVSTSSFITPLAVILLLASTNWRRSTSRDKVLDS